MSDKGEEVLLNSNLRGDEFPNYEGNFIKVETVFDPENPLDSYILFTQHSLEVEVMPEVLEMLSKVQKFNHSRTLPIPVITIYDNENDIKEDGKIAKVTGIDLMDILFNFKSAKGDRTPHITVLPYQPTARTVVHAICTILRIQTVNTREEALEIAKDKLSAIANKRNLVSKSLNEL